MRVLLGFFLGMFFIPVVNVVIGYSKHYKELGTFTDSIVKEPRFFLENILREFVKLWGCNDGERLDGKW